MKQYIDSTGFSYYELSLLSYLKESHPDKSYDKEFIKSRAEQAAYIYENSLRDGYISIQAEELANEALFQGLHFSPIDTLITILWNEFSEEIPQGDARKKAIKILPYVRSIFNNYDLSDDFVYTSQYENLYTELTGAIIIYFEDYGI